jgi:hypothetical protein
MSANVGRAGGVIPGDVITMTGSGRYAIIGVLQ